MNQKNLMSAALLVGAAIVVAQSKPELTARELFYAPASVTAAAQTKKSTVSAVPKSGGTSSTKPVEQQVAVVKKSTTRPTVQTPQLPQTTDEPVMLVTASYSGPRPLGLRYSVLKLQDGAWGEVNADSVFKSGDKIRVKVESNENGYLYIIARGSSGRWDTLFPNKNIHDGDNRVESGEPQTVPNGNGRWTFDEHKGEEKLMLVLSRRPVADVDKLIYDLNDASKPAAAKAPAAQESKKTSAPAEKKAEEKSSAPAKRMMLAQNISPIDDALVGRLRSQVLSRDLVFEKVDDRSSAGSVRTEAAAYVVEKSGKPDARLVVDIKLQHD